MSLSFSPQCGPSIRESTLLFNHALVAKGMHVTAVGGGGNCFSFGTHFDAMATVIELPAEEFDEETEGAYASSLLVPGECVCVWGEGGRGRGSDTEQPHRHTWSDAPFCAHVAQPPRPGCCPSRTLRRFWPSPAARRSYSVRLESVACRFLRAQAFVFFFFFWVCVCRTLSRLKPSAHSAGNKFGNAVSKWKPDYLKKTLAGHEASVHVSAEDKLDFLTRNFQCVGLAWDRTPRRP